MLNANKNIGRKRIDATLRIFATFAADKPSGVKLLLKSVSATSGEYDVAAAVQALDLSARVLTTRSVGLPETLDDETLNWLYNSCDVGINTSECEGWGLIAYEHASCGAPQILPAHPVAAEHWRGYPGLIDVSSVPVDVGGAFLVAGIDEAAAVAVLERLYVDGDFRRQAGAHAMAIAGRTDLSWSAVGERWRVLMLALAGP